MRHFVRQRIKSARVCAFNQHYKSKLRGDVLNIIARELKVEGIVYDLIEAYMTYENDRLKVIKEKYENKFRDYRDKEEKGMEKSINKKLGAFSIHQFL